MEIFAPKLFSQTWMGEQKDERHELAERCAAEFVGMLIKRWVSDDGGRGVEEVALESVALRVRQLYASQRRLDTKQQARDDATLQYEDKVLNRNDGHNFLQLTQLLNAKPRQTTTHGRFVESIAGNSEECTVREHGKQANKVYHFVPHQQVIDTFRHRALVPSQELHGISAHLDRVIEHSENGCEGESRSKESNVAKLAHDLGVVVKNFC